MLTIADDLERRQFYWGLSNGITILAASGTFWFLLAATAAAATWAVGDRYPHIVDGARIGRWSLSAVGVPIALLAGASRVRRKARGFGYRDLRREELAAHSKEISRMFRWTGAAQGAGCAAFALAGLATHREDLIWPGIALVVSLHFILLARAFQLRAYYAAAAAGTVVALTALLPPSSFMSSQIRFVWTGFSMAAVVWSTAAYVTWCADDLADAVASPSLSRA